MKQLGELLREARLSQSISTHEAALELRLKPEILEALEKEDWKSLPDPAYVRGFIKNYSNFLKLDSARLLALYRGQYDEKKFPKRPSLIDAKKRLMFTPNKLSPLAFLMATVIFLSYLVIQYTSVLSAPKLVIYTPQDDTSTTASIIEISGNTEKDTTVSIDGQLVAVDSSGNFNYQLKLEEGKNIIEIVSSRRLSPKSKETRVVRLSR